MLDIRLKLLETDPEYFSFFGNVSQLIKKQSPNVIPFLKLIIKMSDELNHHMHLGEKTTISQYVKSHYRELTNEILPEDVTKQNISMKICPNTNTMNITTNGQDPSTVKALQEKSLKC